VRGDEPEVLGTKFDPFARRKGGESRQSVTFEPQVPCLSIMGLAACKGRWIEDGEIGAGLWVAR
jgi:hypothetical protein